MIDKKEFNRLLLLDGEEFIRAAYKDILLREADSGGISFFCNELKRGTSKQKILFRIMISMEALGKKVNIKEFDLGSISIDELTKYNGDCFIEAMYLSILGRSSDESGRKTNRIRLNNWYISKEDMIIALAYSPEGKSHNASVIGLDKVYKEFRHRQKVEKIPILGKVYKWIHNTNQFNQRAEYEFRMLQQKVEQLETERQKTARIDWDQTNRINCIVGQITELQSKNIGYNAKNMSQSVYNIYSLLNKEDK